MSKTKHNNLITKANKVYNPIAGFDKEIIQIHQNQSPISRSTMVKPPFLNHIRNKTISNEIYFPVN